MTDYILLVDPDPKCEELVRNTFPERKVIVFEEAVGVLNLISEEVPGVIILAVELKNSNGFTLCRNIRKHTISGEVPLILISSEASSETFEKHKLLKDHANGYLLKPILPETLQEIVGPYLNSRSEVTFKPPPTSTWSTTNTFENWNFRKKEKIVQAVILIIIVVAALLFAHYYDWENGSPFFFRR
jgi:two-component system, OmpR family, response regulator